MAKVSYIAYAFRRPPLMEPAHFEALKALPVKAGHLRYHPYDGFFRTFPVWSILLAVAAVWSLVHYLRQEREYWIPLLVFLMVSLFTGGLPSMLSWGKYYLECHCYYREYSDDLNAARTYADFCQLRRGKHG